MSRGSLTSYPQNPLQSTVAARARRQPTWVLLDHVYAGRAAFLTSFLLGSACLPSYTCQKGKAATALVDAATSAPWQQGRHCRPCSHQQVTPLDNQAGVMQLMCLSMGQTVGLPLRMSCAQANACLPSALTISNLQLSPVISVECL